MEPPESLAPPPFPRTLPSPSPPTQSHVPPSGQPPPLPALLPPPSGQRSILLPLDHLHLFLSLLLLPLLLHHHRPCSTPPPTVPQPSPWSQSTHQPTPLDSFPVASHSWSWQTPALLCPLREVARADGIVQVHVPFSLRDLSQTEGSADLSACIKEFVVFPMT